MKRSDWIDNFLTAERLPEQYRVQVHAVHEPLARRIASAARKQNGEMYIVGLCGAQGSGKSTMAASLARVLAQDGLSTAVLSLDDVYLTQAERHSLSARIHPLFKTRGVPGTHDVELAMEVIRNLRRAGAVALPRFDKARDERCPRNMWPVINGPVDVLVFEGWCVGARPQPNEELIEPVNELEQAEDASGVWRRHSNEVLGSKYQQLFGELNFLVLLRVPDFDYVYRRRLEQERKLFEHGEGGGGDAARAMDELRVRRFISHYQRLTYHILQEMPPRADIVLDAAPIE